MDGLDGLVTAQHSDATPQCVYDKEKEGRKASPSLQVAVDTRKDLGNLKFIAGITMGILLSAIYVRLGVAI